MRKFLTIIALLVSAGVGASARTYSLANDRLAVCVGEDGSLLSLKDVATGQDYASGGYLWRLYYDSPEEKEIQVVGDGQVPEISEKGNEIEMRYSSLSSRGRALDIRMTLRVILEPDLVRFAVEMENNEPHTVIREIHYPLVRNINLPSDHKLYTSEAGGKLYSDPVRLIGGQLSASPYKTPEQFFRSKDVKYGSKVFMNCFALIGENQGLYFGSHDETFQDTWHGIRVYKGADGKFDELECGFYKYPHCFAGHKWSCEANVVSAYAGTWHVASRLYRRWVDTWWDHRETPLWVRQMNSWQRVIFKHQYGEYFFRYPDLYGRLKDVDRSVNSNAVFLFGWWAEGMDHGNPDYSPDESQGGDAVLKDAIAKYQSDGSRLLLYFNGKLIDRESRFYKSGLGSKVCRHDNTGSELHEHYRFTGMGTWLGEYDARTFAVATMMDSTWNQVLFSLQDRAHALGASSVFFDQLGYVERQSTNWDCSGEYPVPDVFGIAKRAQTLKLLRDRYAEKDPEFALGAEATVDVLAQFCDYTHGYPANDSPERFINFFRYTFPELVFTDRGQRDDNDVFWHVNNTVLDGQRNDIEIYRCRDLIDDSPVYQAYLSKVNALKTKYKDELLLGRYNDVLGFTNSNPDVDARAFVGKDRIAVVVANQQRAPRSLKSRIDVPGYRFADWTALRGAEVSSRGIVRLGQYDLAVLIFEKND